MTSVCGRRGDGGTGDGAHLAVVGVVIRAGLDGGPRVAVVQHARDRAWMFPEGRTRHSESSVTAALRHVRARTGLLCIATAQLDAGAGDAGPGRRAWAMHRLAGTFSPGAGIDALQWVRPAEAVLLLSHERDRTLLCTNRELLDRAVDRMPMAAASG